VKENQDRRSFLRTTAIGGAAAITGTRSDAAPGKFPDNPLVLRGGQISRGYPVFPIAKAGELKSAEARTFVYPDKESPCLLIKTGNAVPGGVGPENDIVAYSAMCTHMGCTVSYDSSTQTLKCPCHFSVFDPENCGQMVCGQATEDLPQIELSFDSATGRISAVGVRGSLYGRISNLL
jgi:arsenite oxidase small subunit